MSAFPVVFSLMGFAFLIQIIQLNKTLRDMCILLAAIQTSNPKEMKNELPSL